MERTDERPSRRRHIAGSNVPKTRPAGKGKSVAGARPAPARTARRHSPGKPLVSVITVVLNGRAYLEETMRSVFSQTYDNIEYIVIDGGSTDGSLDIIKRCRDGIDYWVSEPDAGIYDAMNKGARASRGDIVYFLNCGDYLYSDDVVARVVQAYGQVNGHGIVHGNVLFRVPSDGFEITVGRPVGIRDLSRGRTICHQALFMSREILLGNGMFDTRYNLAADFDLLCKGLSQRHPVVYMNTMIAVYRFEGKSSNPDAVTSEAGRVIRLHFGGYAYGKYAVMQKIKIVRKTLRFILMKSGALAHLRRMKHYRLLMQRIDF